MSVKLSENMNRSLNALRLEVAEKIADDVRYWVEVEVQKQVQAERDAISSLILRAESDARTQRRLREDLSQMVKERGIG